MHAAIFGVLTLLGCWTFPARRTAAALLAYGVAVEVVQGLAVPGRSASLLDVVADAVGIGAALAVSARRQ